MQSVQSIVNRNLVAERLRLVSRLKLVLPLYYIFKKLIYLLDLSIQDTSYGSFTSFLYEIGVLTYLGIFVLILSPKYGDERWESLDVDTLSSSVARHYKDFRVGKIPLFNV